MPGGAWFRALATATTASAGDAGVLLHADHGGHAVSFEALFASIVVAMLLVGLLWYLRVFHRLANRGGE